MTPQKYKDSDIVYTIFTSGSTGAPKGVQPAESLNLLHKLDVRTQSSWFKSTMAQLRLFHLIYLHVHIPVFNDCWNLKLSR